MMIKLQGEWVRFRNHGCGVWGVKDTEVLSSMAQPNVLPRETVFLTRAQQQIMERALRRSVRIVAAGREADLAELSKRIRHPTEDELADVKDRAKALGLIDD